MAAQKEMDDILALASELDMDVTEDEQGESWMGTGGVLLPSAVPVAPSKDGLDISRGFIARGPFRIRHAGRGRRTLRRHDRRGFWPLLLCSGICLLGSEPFTEALRRYGRARLHKVPKRNGSVLLPVVELGQGCFSGQGGVG